MTFAAPEVWKNELTITPAVDVWSLGVVLFCLLYGPVLEGAAGPFDWTKQHNNNKEMSEEARSLMESLLQMVPKKRPTLQEIAQHPWFKTGTT